LATMKELELLAAAVAGRSIPLERTRGGVHTDGATIFVGEAPETGDEGLRRAVIAQAALIAAGSLERQHLRRLARASGDASRRYLGLEVVRASAVLEPTLPSRFQAALAPYAGQVGVTGSSELSLRLALSGQRLAEAPAWFGELHPVKALKASPGGRSEAPSDNELAAALRAAAEEPEDDDDDEDDGGDGERSRLMELLSTPIKNPLSAALQRMLGTRRSAGDGPGGVEITMVSHRQGDPGPAARRAKGPSSLVTVGGQLTHGATYPEWDHRRQQLRESWCTVGEFDTVPASDAVLTAATADARLMRELARLGLTWRPHNGEPAGDDLDLTALVDHCVGVRAGTAGEPRVFRAERRTAQELGVLILLDATGSTAELDQGRSLFEEQRDLALGLTTSLNQMGIRVGTYAFYSRGRQNVRFLRCKSFDEPWGQTAQRRLAGVTPSGFTRLGAAIRHSTHLLETRAGTRRRLLIVIGDGISYDDGYEGRYALEDSRRAVDEARARAVACVGLSTRPVHGDAIWPPEAHRVTSTPAELAHEARELFTSAIRTVDRTPSKRTLSQEAR
jgi:nitric oxide reductase NorD protein